MKRIKKVLTTVNYSAGHLKELRELFPESEFVNCDVRDTQMILRHLKDSDVAILSGDADVRFLLSDSLKWIHCDHAGLNLSARREFFEKGIRISGSAGRSSPVLAEHCIYFMLQSCYQTKKLLQAQKKHQWGFEGIDSLRGLYGKTVGIIGMGHNGRALCERLRGFGVKIIAYNYTDFDGFDYVDRKLIGPVKESLHELYRQSDFIVLCIALNDDTRRMIGYEQFVLMKKGVTLINMSRGEIIDTQALLSAIDEGIVACAGLDVFETEPLPANSALWDKEEIYITPHCTPQVPDREARSLEIIAENVMRYRNDRPLINEIKTADSSLQMNEQEIAFLKKIGYQ